VLEFLSLDNSSSKSILDVLEIIYLMFRKTIVQRVAVGKLEVYDGGGNYIDGVMVKVGTDTAESTNVMIAGFRQIVLPSAKLFWHQLISFLILTLQRNLKSECLRPL